MALNVTNEQKKVIESQGFMVVEFKLWYRKLGEILLEYTQRIIDTWKAIMLFIQKKLADLEKNKAKIAMAAIEIDSKNGAENQLSHSENGISRTFSEYLMAYKGVVGFANCI